MGTVINENKKSRIKNFLQIYLIAITAMTNTMMRSKPLA